MRDRQIQLATSVCKLTLIAACLLVASLLIVCSTADAANAEVYGVNGFSILTGDTVRGVIDDTYLNGTVSGVLEENDAAVRVNGTWSGVGLMEVFSEDGRWYEVEVVE